MLFKKLLRTMALYKAQFISMIIMSALGIGIFVGFNMEWVSIEENMSSFFEETGFADYRIVSSEGFTEDELEKIDDLETVSQSARFFSVNADVVSNDSDTLALNVTTNSKVSFFTLIQGEEYDEKSVDGIWISDKYAQLNNIKIGDEITLSFMNVTAKGKVKGLVKSGEYMICVRDETQLMPDYNTFGFAYVSPEFYKNSVGFEFYPQIRVLSDADKKQFTKAVDDTLEKTSLILTKDETVSYSEAKGESNEGKTMGSILPVLFLAIALLTMITTMHRLTAKEKTQIGTLKALGFKDRKILVHYASYAFMIAVVSSAAGIGLGYAVAYAVMNPNGMMGTYLDMPRWDLRLPWFCVGIIVFIIALMTFIGVLSVKQMLKGTAADALRPYTPKKMKPLLIEKTELFHKLSFSARWNMRDIMRHKSRTAMSILGILGCTLLIIASLGMKDTMDAFVKLYYDGATNYASKIFLFDETPSQQSKALAEKYNGDMSGSVSVQLEEKAVSLDIYNIENDRVRFPAVKTGYEKLTDDGAFVCMRLKDEFSIEKGDTITLKPYGSDKKYDLKVAGFIRSVSECVVVSSSFADKEGIQYSINAIYTQTEKSDIESDEIIKSVQSKQMIIDSFDTFISIMNTMVYILVLGALVLGIVVLYNLGVMSYTERYRELATLKVLGFKDSKIRTLLVGQNFYLSVVGVTVGLPAGIGTLYYLLIKLAGEYEMRLALSVYSIIYTILLTVGMSVLVSLMVSRKNKKIDMVEALKDAE
ncbi:MAG: FtsX-like permease family protein [Clostridia bacterium]|nr:FtsX-like permease family protein [Clostridia bacterium]